MEKEKEKPTQTTKQPLPWRVGNYSQGQWHNQALVEESEYFEVWEVFMLSILMSYGIQYV
jgi:hypothetical protein